METVLNFISNNKEWLFSGLGASAIIGSVAYIFKNKQDSEKTQTQTVSQNVTVNVNSEKEASTKVFNIKSIDKESISILFIDDQTFDYINHLKNAGYINKKQAILKLRMACIFLLVPNIR